MKHHTHHPSHPHKNQINAELSRTIAHDPYMAAVELDKIHITRQEMKMAADLIDGLISQWRMEQFPENWKKYGKKYK